MNILLDECGDQRLRHAFPEHDRRTAAYAKLAGLKNGALLDAAEKAGFAVMITTDQEIPYQQNLGHRRISIIILKARTHRFADLTALLPEVRQILASIAPGQVITVDGA